MREILTDAIEYWEMRRLVYNAVLALIVVAVAGMQLEHPVSAIKGATIQGMFLLAVLANVCYSTAYLVDVPIQFSAFAPVWKKLRWFLFAIGLMFAGIITRFISSALIGYGN